MTFSENRFILNKISKNDVFSDFERLITLKQKFNLSGILDIDSRWLKLDFSEIFRNFYQYAFLLWRFAAGYPENFTPPLGPVPKLCAIWILRASLVILACENTIKRIISGNNQPFLCSFFLNWCFFHSLSDGIKIKYST